MRPCWLQVGPSWAVGLQVGPSWPKLASGWLKLASSCLQMPQVGPKLASSWPKLGPADWGFTIVESPIHHAWEFTEGNGREIPRWSPRNEGVNLSYLVCQRSEKHQCSLVNLETTLLNYKKELAPKHQKLSKLGSAGSDGLKMAHVGPKLPPEASSWPQVGLKLAQVGPKLASSWPKLAPSWLQVGSSWPT